MVGALRGCDGGIAGPPHGFRRGHGRVTAGTLLGPAPTSVKSIGSGYSSTSSAPADRLSARFLNRTIHFTRWPNPHGPGFFLNRHQFERWESQSYYLDHDQGFIGPLESAQTLGVMKTFPVYKSAAPNAAFLEFHHVDNRYLDKRIRIR